MSKRKGTIKELIETLRQVQEFMRHCNAHHQNAPGRKGFTPPHPELADKIDELLGDGRRQ
jgi:hypothetical protein